MLSKDGEKLFYLTSFDKGNDLWVTELRTKETKLLAKLGAERRQHGAVRRRQVHPAPGRRQGRRRSTPRAAKAEPLKVSGEMVLKQADERNYIFDHAWRQFKEKFYVADLHGVDWDFYYGTYRKFLPFINNNYDFAEMLSEMLGEMNASHTGCYYRRRPPNARPDRVARAASSTTPTPATA